MNTRFVISVAALFVASMALGFVVHGVLLNADYVRLQHLFRTETDARAYFPFMLAAHLATAAGLTWMYRQGRNSRPWLGQGVRFGLGVVLLVTVPLYLIYFAVQPMPSDVVAKQIVLDGLRMVILGIIAAAINRDPLPVRA
jgi:hypothetical protein